MKIILSLTISYVEDTSTDADIQRNYRMDICRRSKSTHDLCVCPVEAELQLKIYVKSKETTCPHPYIQFGAICKQCQNTASYMGCR